MECPGCVADNLSGFWRSAKPGDRDATRGTDGLVCGGIGAVSRWAVELLRGGRVAGDQRSTPMEPASVSTRGARSAVRGQPKEQLSCGESQGRVPPGRRNFGNRNQDKRTFGQSAVR